MSTILVKRQLYQYNNVNYISMEIGKKMMKNGSFGINYVLLSLFDLLYILVFQHFTKFKMLQFATVLQCYSSF